MDLPKDWFNRDAKKLAEESANWPDWMKAGVQESIDRAKRKSRLENDGSNEET
jgi:hypothetical protein